MKITAALCALAMSVAQSVLAQEAAISVVTAAEAEVTPPVDEPAHPHSLNIPRDTPIHLMVVSEVTTKTHSVGHRFRLRVDQPVVIDGATVIPVGATAWGQVTSATSSGNVGKSGTLSAELLYVEAGDTRIAIDGQTASKGKSGTGEVVMGVIGLGLLGLLAKGNNAKIKAGEKMTAFTIEDTSVPHVAASS